MKDGPSQIGIAVGIVRMFIPKARLKSVVDGQRVNIPVPLFIDNEGRRRLSWPDVGYRFKRSRC